MAVFIMLILVILLGSLFEPIIKKRGYVIISFILFILILGLSAREVGLNDRELVYPRVFELMNGTTSLKQAWLIARSRVSSGYGFYFITWLLTRFIHSYDTYLFVLAIPFNVVVAHFIYKYSSNTRLSLLVYATFIYPLTFTIIRQTLAMSVLYFAIQYLDKKKIKMCIAFVLLASSIHLSVTVFALCIIFAYIPFKRKYLLLIPCVAALSFMGKSVILKILSVVIFDSSYQTKYLLGDASTFVATMGILIRLSIFIFLYCANYLFGNGLDRIKSGSRDKQGVVEKSDFLLWNSEMMVISTLLMATMSEFQRIITYFDFFSIISIPKALGIFKPGISRKIADALIEVVLVIYFIGFQLDNWGLSNYITFF